MTKGLKGLNVLITGGLGFIGSNLAIQLVESGASVELYDALIKEMGGNKFNVEQIKKQVKVTIADLRNKEKISKSVRNKDIIFNLAGTLSHVDSMTNPFFDLDINCRAQLELLEACRKYNPRVKIVFAGTRNQYGKAKYLPVDENHPQEPTDINGINAIAGEKYHLMYGSIYGFKVVSLRMSNTFGPRHQMRHSKQGVLNWFIKQLLQGETVRLFGDGSQIRDVNYVEDVCEALILVAISDKSNGQVYNLGGSPISLREFVEKAIKILGRGKWKQIAFPADRKNIEIGNYIADTKKLTKDIKWRPKTRIEFGISETFEYYKKYKPYYF